MTVLEKYQARREICELEIGNSCFRQDEIMDIQELDYRISVMSTLQSLLAAVPLTVEMAEIAYHYQVLTGYIDQVAKERRFGPAMDERQVRKRDTALAFLLDVIEDGKKRFKGFVAEDVLSYRKKIALYCQSVLSAWIQYRETYIRLYI